MSCHLLEATLKADPMMIEVDQILIDTSQQRIELRVARTMATSVPVDWTFRRGDPSSPSAKDTIDVLPTNKNELLIVAIRYISAYAFSLDRDGIFVMTYTSPGAAAESFRWKCER